MIRYGMGMWPTVLLARGTPLSQKVTVSVANRSDWKPGRKRAKQNPLNNGQQFQPHFPQVKSLANSPLNTSLISITLSIKLVARISPLPLSLSLSTYPTTPLFFSLCQFVSYNCECVVCTVIYKIFFPGLVLVVFNTSCREKQLYHTWKPQSSSYFKA